MHFLLRKRTCTHHHASVHEHTHTCLPSACFLAVLVSSGIASALALTSWSFLLCFPGLCVLSVWLFCVFSWVSPFLCWRLPWLSHAPWLCWYLRIGPEALCAWGGLGPVRGRDVGAGTAAEWPGGWAMIWAELSVEEIFPVSVSIVCVFEVPQIFQSGMLKFSIWEVCASLPKFWKLRERERKRAKGPIVTVPLPPQFASWVNLTYSSLYCGECAALQGLSSFAS